MVVQNWAVDVLMSQEQHKAETTNGQWRCTYCSKVRDSCNYALFEVLMDAVAWWDAGLQLFRSEHYLDKHMGLKHPETINVRLLSPTTPNRQ